MNIAIIENLSLNENMLPASGLPNYFIFIGQLLIFICGLFTPSLSYSKGLSLESISMRARVSENTLFGEDAQENFEEYDVSANYRLPWKIDWSGWDVGTRLMASTGILRGADENALVISLIPELTLGSEDRWFTVDLGAGVALLSRHRFGIQDFGGPFQFAVTIGISVPFDKKLGIGYRFLHYSDAGVNGSDTIGADFHMIEFSYRF